MELDMMLSEHFSLYELTRSETAARKGIDNTPTQRLAGKLIELCQVILEPIREQFGRPYRPNSGYRSPALNVEVGGSKNSQHCRAEAVDIEIAGVSNFKLAEWIRNNLVFDQLILECYTPGIPNSGWVHVSYRAGQNRGRVMTYSGGKYLSGLVA